MTKSRKARLKKSAWAELDVTNYLLELRRPSPRSTEADPAFKGLYYLLRLAKRAR